MKLYEVNIGDTIQLIFSKDNKQYISECEVIDINNTYIITKQMEENGTPVAIEKVPWLIRVVYQQKNGVPVIWDNVPAMDFVNPENGSKGHIMTCTHDGWQTNRRGAFRLKLNIKATLFKNDNTEKTPGMIKDISTSGVAFIANADMDIMGKMVMLHFKDEDLMHTMQLNIRIVRKSTERNGFLYGAVIVSSSYDIGKYIADRQRLLQRDRLGL